MKKFLSFFLAAVIIISVTFSVFAVVPVINNDFSYNTMFADGQPVTYTGTTNNWVTKSGTQLMLNGSPFISIGFTNYGHSTASYEYIKNQMVDAKNAGFNVIRVCDMVSPQYNDGLPVSSESWKSEANWVQTDFIINTAKQLGMKVLIDLATFREYFYDRSPRVDCYDPAIRSYWDSVCDFITSRVNTFTGVAYKNDPTVFSYAILGEPVPFGGALNDWTGGVNSSRDARLVVDQIIYIAKKLKTDSPNALIQTGGLLHITDNAGFRFTITSADVTNWGLTLPANTAQYYTNILWNSSYIDYATIHIYPINYSGFVASDYFNADNTYKSTKGYEWENLATFITKAGNKPFMVEEFGIDRTFVTNAQATGYFNYCFGKMNSANIRHAIVWNIGYGDGYDVGPQDSDVWGVFKSYATSWNTTDIQGLPFGPLNPLRASNVSSSLLMSSYERRASLTKGGGNQSIGTVSLETTTYTDGVKSMKMPINLIYSYGWQDFSLGVETSRTIGTNNYLAVDCFLPSTTDSVCIRMGFTAGGIGYTESDYSWQTNFLIPGQWKTIYIPLTNLVANAHGNVYSGSPSTSASVTAVNLSIRNLTTIGNTYILFDNVRLVDTIN